MILYFYFYSIIMNIIENFVSNNINIILNDINHSCTEWNDEYELDILPENLYIVHVKEIHLYENTSTEDMAGYSDSSDYNNTDTARFKKIERVFIVDDQSIIDNTEEVLAGFVLGHKRH